jgi:hypothetical protein
VIASTRRAVDLCVVEPVQQVNSARCRGREHDAQAAGQLGIAAGGKCGCFFMAATDKADAVLGAPEGFDKAVDPVAGKPKTVSMPQSVRIATMWSQTVSAMITLRAAPICV